MAKISTVKQQLEYLLSDSSLVIVEEVPYEGKEVDYEKTADEKQRLFNEIIKIVYPKHKI